MSDDNENEQPLNLDIPDHLEYSEEHAWVDRSVDPAIIGITEYAADLDRAESEDAGGGFTQHTPRIGSECHDPV